MTPSTHEALVRARDCILSIQFAGSWSAHFDRTIVDTLALLDAALLLDPKADGAGNVGLSLGGEILTRADVIGRLKHGGEHLGNAIAGYRDKDNHRAAHGLFDAATAMLNAIAWLEHDADALSTLSRERGVVDRWIRDHGLKYERQAIEAEATIAELRKERVKDAETLMELRERLAIRNDTITELTARLAEAKGALAGMLRHSCVADSAAEDKDAEDHDAERAARAFLAATPSQGQPTKARERDAKDYAIEFGGYLANAAENYLRFDLAHPSDATADGYKAMLSSIYEFRKRADYAYSPAPALASPAKASEPQWRADLLEGGGKGKQE